MIYKVLNFLFGFDYIIWKNSCDSGISRVRKDYSGNVWYWRYRTTHIADIICEPKQVMWLTCKPSKYFGD